MARQDSRISPDFVASQKTKRTDLANAPSQANGLPGAIERIEAIEAILALHSYAAN